MTEVTLQAKDATSPMAGNDDVLICGQSPSPVCTCARRIDLRVARTVLRAEVW